MAGGCLQTLTFLTNTARIWAALREIFYNSCCAATQTWCRRQQRPAPGIVRPRPFNWRGKASASQCQCLVVASRDLGHIVGARGCRFSLAGLCKRWMQLHVWHLAWLEPYLGAAAGKMISLLLKGATTFCTHTHARLCQCLADHWMQLVVAGRRVSALTPRRFILHWCVSGSLVLKMCANVPCSFVCLVYFFPS